MGSKLTFNQAMQRRGTVMFKMSFIGIDKPVDCVADSEAHRDLILKHGCRRRWNVDSNQLVTGFTVSFVKKHDLTLGHSIPAVLHGLEYQNANRINSDPGDFRKSNFRKVKTR